MDSKIVATKIVKILQDHHHIAYFAGGWVRDLLLGKPSDDIDIATSASIEEIAILFPKTIPVGASFGILIIVEEGFHFEVATFRKEFDYIDGRRPTKIEHATPKEDAMRRDFTINGMFFDPISETLFDFVGGQKDLQSKKLRAIGDPHHRFLEDRLRMIRAVRYATRFGFTIECDTKQAILSHAKALFPSVAIERIWQEFHKMNRFSLLFENLLLLHEFQLLSVIFPNLAATSLETLHARLSPLRALDKQPPVIATIVFLFPPLSLLELEDLCFSLKISAQEKNIALFLHSSLHLLEASSCWTLSLDTLAIFYAHPLSSLAISLKQITLPETISKAFIDMHEEKRTLLSPFIARIQQKRALISSKDLLEEGISPGISMGLLLKEAESLSICMLSEDKYQVLTALKQTTLWKQLKPY